MRVRHLYDDTIDCWRVIVTLRRIRRNVIIFKKSLTEIAKQKIIKITRDFRGQKGNDAFYLIILANFRLTVKISLKKSKQFVGNFLSSASTFFFAHLKTFNVYIMTSI